MRKFSDLPTDALVIVAEFLVNDANDITSFALLSKTCNNVLKSEQTNALYQYLYYLQFGTSFWSLPTGVIGSKTTVLTYKENEEGIYEEEEDCLISLVYEKDFGITYVNKTPFKGLDYQAIIKREQNTLKSLSIKLVRTVSEGLAEIIRKSIVQYFDLCAQNRDWCKLYFQQLKACRKWTKGAHDVPRNVTLDDYEAPDNVASRTGEPVIRILICGENSENKKLFISKLATHWKKKGKIIKVGNITSTTEGLGGYGVIFCECESPIDWYFSYRGAPVDAIIYYLDPCDDNFDESYESERYRDFHSKYCYSLLNNIIKV
jgi:hypothetical protein